MDRITTNSRSEASCENIFRKKYDPSLSLNLTFPLIIRGRQSRTIKSWASLMNLFDILSDTPEELLLVAIQLNSDYLFDQSLKLGAFNFSEAIESARMRNRYQYKARLEKIVNDRYRNSY